MHKYFGYGQFFCWNCGSRRHTGRKVCPHCGAHYNTLKKPVGRRVKPSTWMGPMHPTVLWYIFGYVFFCLLFAFGWCCIMYFVMDVKFEDHQWIVYAILWGFWSIWLVCFVFSKFANVPKARAKNKLMGDKAVCAMCGAVYSRMQNYCDDCGTVLFTDHTGYEPEVKVPGKK